jgi:hypothetical protein
VVSGRAETACRLVDASHEIHLARQQLIVDRRHSLSVERARIIDRTARPQDIHKSAVACGRKTRLVYLLTVGESVPPGAGLSWQAARAPICASNLKPETAHRTGRLRKDGGVIS